MRDRVRNRVWSIRGVWSPLLRNTPQSMSATRPCLEQRAPVECFLCINRHVRGRRRGRCAQRSEGPPRGSSPGISYYIILPLPYNIICYTILYYNITCMYNVYIIGAAGPPRGSSPGAARRRSRGRRAAGQPPAPPRVRHIYIYIYIYICIHMFKHTYIYIYIYTCIIIHTSLHFSARWGRCTGAEPVCCYRHTGAEPVCCYRLYL